MIAQLLLTALLTLVLVYAWSAHRTVPIIGLLARGLFTVAPNEPLVLQIFGAYAGTVRTPGLRWANPFYTKRKVSVRVRNFESAKLKVNDNEGNPIEIAAVVVDTCFSDRIRSELRPAWRPRTARRS